MWLFCVLFLFTVASANLLSERGSSPIRRDELNDFTYYFRKSLYDIIEYKKGPLRERFDREYIVCEAKLAEQESSCSACTEKVNCDSEPVNDVLKDCEQIFKDLGKKLRDGLKDIGKPFEEIGKGLKKIGEQVIDKVKDVGEDIVNGVKKVGKAVENGIKDVANTVHKVFVPRIRLPRIRLPRVRLPRIRRARIRFRVRRVFGKKKRSVNYFSESEELESYPSNDDAEYALFRRNIEPEDRMCMEKCTACQPFLLDDEKAQLRSLCGEEYSQLMHMLLKLEVLEEHVLDNEDLIVKSVDCDVKEKDQCTRAHINVYFEEGFQTYQSKHPFKALDIPISAALMAKEYYDLFMES